MLRNIIVNIGVAGESGAGKSSLVNAIRGLQDGDEEAAPTGLVDSSILKPVRYPHPTMLNVVLWDLPGIEVTELKTFMKDSMVQNCDLFFIVCMSKFKEKSKRLAKELEKGNRRCYFVRSHVDQDVRAAERRGQTEEQTLQEIRREYEENLKDLGRPPLFLISSLYPQQFDLQELVETLQRDLSQHKRDAVTRCSQKAIDKKCHMFKICAWGLAFLSGAIATARVPWLSLACDFAMSVGLYTKSYYSFGLHVKSHAIKSGKANKLINKNDTVKGLVLATGGRKLLLHMALKASVCLIATHLAPSSGGTVAVAGMAFFSTCFVLLHGLNHQRKAAQNAAVI